MKTLIFCIPMLWYTFAAANALNTKCLDQNDPLCGDLDLSRVKKPKVPKKKKAAVAEEVKQVPAPAPVPVVVEQVKTVEGERDASGNLVVTFDDHNIEGQAPKPVEVKAPAKAVEAEICQKEYTLANKLRESGNMNKAEKAYEALFKCYEDSLVEKDDSLKLVCKQYGDKKIISLGLETGRFFIRSESIYFWKQLVYIQGRMKKCEKEGSDLFCSSELSAIQLDDDSSSVKGLVDVFLTLPLDSDGDVIEERVKLNSYARMGVAGGMNGEGYDCERVGGRMFTRRSLFREAYKNLPNLNQTTRK
jgi:hypothetical protein